MAAIASAAVFAIGASGILGWHLHLPELARPLPGYGSMKYNTALLLALSGFGLGALVLGRRTPARVVSLMVAALATSTLVEFLAGVDLGIDQLALRDADPSRFPGRPAPNTALSLLCVALGLFIASLSPTRGRLAWVGVLSTLTLSIVVVATLGFVAGIEPAYAWLGLGQMAPHTAASLGIAALVLSRLAWRDVGVSALGPSWLPAACLIAGVALSAILSESLQAGERSQNRRTDRLHAEGVAREVRAALEAPSLTLVRMADRWALNQKPSRARFESEARFILRDFAGLQAVAWIDSRGEIAWAVSGADFPEEVEADLWVSPEAVRQAREAHFPTAVLPDSSRGADRRFQVLVPIDGGTRTAGLLIGLFDPELVLSAAMEALAPGYGVVIFGGAKPVFERAKAAANERVTTEVTFEWAGASWIVHVAPGPNAEGRIRSGLPEVMLIGGLCLSGLLALSVFLAQKAARREHDAVVDNRRMERLWNSGVIGILDILPGGAVIQANDEMLRILGYERADIASGRLRWDNLTPPEHRPADAHAQAELDARGFATPWQKELLRKDGSRVPVLTGLAIVEPGTQEGMAVVLDQTAHRRAEELATRLASIVESSDDAIASISLDHVVTSWNAGAARLYGYTAEEMIGTSVEILTPPDHELERREAVAKALDGEHLSNFETVRRRKDGAELEVSITLSPIRNAEGRVTGASAITRDVTLRKQAEEELRHAKERAESADRAKSDFVAHISHELRTPLNGILGMLDLCLDSELDAEQLQQVETARRAADALLVIVNDLLDLSKIEAGKLDIEAIEFDLRDCLRDTMRSLQESTRKKGLAFSRYVAPDVPALVAGDPGRLRQILVNLVGNAIKFTELGEVTVACTIVSRTPDSAVVRLVVEDTGIGIPEEQQRAIFEPFAQADTSTTRRFGGTGLGLSISLRLVNAMGGHLHLESEPGRGSRFSFELPLGVIRWEAASGVASLPMTIRGLRVLVVDASAEMRAELEGWLRSWEMRAEGAASAAQALEKIADAAGDPFRLVVLDAELPGTDGFPLARSIRALATSAETTLLLLTCGGSEGEAKRCAELDIRGYLRKPIDSSSFFEAILQNLGDPALGRPPSRLATRDSLREQVGWMRILLVEDNAFNEAVAVQVLERQGVIVSVARNGALAVEAVAAGRFDLVLMDVEMPVMDGMTATRAIRAAERGTDRHVPVVAMTARAMKGDPRACLDAGMDAYLAKPIDLRELMRTIERLAARGSGVASPPRSPAAEAAVDTAVDRDTVLAKVGGDVELLGRLLALFEEQAAELLTDLREGVAARNTEAVRFAAHAIKGSIAHWTTGRPYEIARDLEEGPAEGAKDLLDPLDAEVTLLERALRALEQSLRQSVESPKQG